MANYATTILKDGTKIIHTFVVRTSGLSDKLIFHKKQIQQSCRTVTVVCGV